MKRMATVFLCLALMITTISQTAIISLAVGTPTISCASKECYPGDTVTVEVNITNNPGIMYLEITPTYPSELGTPTVQNGTIISDLTKGKQYIWVADNDVYTNGTLVTFAFNIAESVTPGDYSVGFIFRSAYNYNEESVVFTVVPATITVKTKLGDVNNDTKVDITDAMFLFRYVSGTEQLSADNLSRLDINGDGVLTLADALLLYRVVSGRITL